MNLVDELLGIVVDLESAAVPYALCGGLAVAIHGHPRFTHDIDLLIQPDDLSRVRDIARLRGFTLEGGRIAFGTGTPSERALHRIAKASGVEALTLDPLLVGPSLASVWNQRKRATWRDHDLWVVSRDGLIHMKRLSGRLQDLADIEALKQSEGRPSDE